MNLNSADRISRVGAKKGRAFLPLFLTAALLAVTTAAYGGFVSASSSATTTSFDNVQVTVHTTNSVPNYSYSVSVYNTTGGLVASYQSQYAAAAFELPSGSYIFAASATGQQSVYPIPVLTNGGSATPTASANGGSSTAIICCVYGEPVPQSTDVCCINNYPAMEYGYASQQVTGSTALTISTRPLNETSVSTLTLRVTYPNGTAASGVYLSASVLGDVNGWAYGTSSLSLSNTTGAGGTATLVAPTVPILVSAETSVPIVLPFNQTTIQVTVAGEKVNVTAFWEPSYLSFTGQALILPPQTSASITLHYEAQSQGPIPLGIATQTATGAVTGSPGKSSILGQTTLQQQATIIAPAAGAASGISSAPGTNVAVLSVLALAISVAALGTALFVTRARPGRVAQ
jgi:hypothetical protein